MGFDPALFFTNLFLANKEADQVKTQHKIKTINARKISNIFQFNNDLLSLDSTFGKHNKDIYLTELELRKENNCNSCDYFLDIYIYIENGEFHTKLLGKRNTFFRPCKDAILLLQFFQQHFLWENWSRISQNFQRNQ